MITKQKTIFKVFHKITILIAFVILTSCSSEKNHWEEARSKNSISAYKKFLEQYPKGEFTEQANIGIMGIYYEQAKVTGSISACIDFIDRYSKGDYIKQARKMIEKIYTGFSKEKVMKIDSISNYVRKGKLVFKKGSKTNTIEVELPGDIPVVNGKWCIGCAEIIKIEPDLRIRLSFFYDVMKPKGLERPPNLPSFAEYKLTLEIPIPNDTTECIISGSKGATLMKKANGFQLLEGEAHLFRKKID